MIPSVLVSSLKQLPSQQILLKKIKILTIKGEVQKPAEAPLAPSKPQKSPLEVN